jgi:coenzyme F420-reducing hydrogenase delta subunit
VDPDRCASCGICAGACPSSTPFRSASSFVSGIEMPQLPVQVMRDRLRSALESAPGLSRIIVFGCDCGADVSSLADSGVATLSLPCTGMLPPAFIGYALRRGALGVVVSVCREGDCAYRVGAQWTLQRIEGTREPKLRRSVPRDRLRVVAAGHGQTSALHAAVQSLRELRPRSSPEQRLEQTQ